MISCLHLMEVKLFSHMNVCHWHVHLGVINDEFSGYRSQPEEDLQIKVNQCELKLFKPLFP